MSANEIAEKMNVVLKEASVYIVQPGDVVWNIAKSKGLTLKEMQIANPGKDLGHLGIGEHINIPEGEELAQIRQQLAKPTLKGEFNLDNTVAQAAAQYGINSNLLKALIFVESSNNPKADSGAAQGLTQLTPYVQKIVGVQDPFDPVQNVYGGAHWLNIAMSEAKRLKGADPRKHLVHALMIYTAGSPAVQKWINAGSPPAGYGAVKGKTLSYPHKIIQLAGQYTN